MQLCEGGEIAHNQRFGFQVQQHWNSEMPGRQSCTMSKQLNRPNLSFLPPRKCNNRNFFSFLELTLTLTFCNSDRRVWLRRAFVQQEDYFKLLLIHFLCIILYGKCELDPWCKFRTESHFCMRLSPKTALAWHKFIFSLTQVHFQLDTSSFAETRLEGAKL